jgi:hypothetical protein
LRTWRPRAQDAAFALLAMPLRYSFDEAIAVIHMSGEYSTVELRDAVLRALSDPACPPKPGLLCDLRGSESIKGRNADDVQGMARFLASLRSRLGGRVAMLVDSNVAFGMMRLGASAIPEEGLKGQIFRELPAARAWLLGGDR